MPVKCTERFADKLLACTLKFFTTVNYLVCKIPWKVSIQIVSLPCIFFTVIKAVICEFFFTERLTDHTIKLFTTVDYHWLQDPLKVKRQIISLYYKPFYSCKMSLWCTDMLIDKPVEHFSAVIYYLQKPVSMGC